jgi:hypothetical protein
MVARCGEGSMGGELKRLRQKAVDREEWASEIKEAKAVRRP